MTFYPTRLLLTAALIIGLSAMLSMASTVRQAGTVGVVGVVAYLAFDVFFTINIAGLVPRSPITTTTRAT